MDRILAGLPAGTVEGVTTSSPLVIFTDGACAGNPGPGGWAWAVSPDGEPCGSGGAVHTTNQRMEVQAAFSAIQNFADHPGPLEIVSDSTYVVKCFTDKWWEGWLRRGWLNSQKQPVANRDLWEPFIALVRARGDVTFRWVKGHSGHPMNDLVDQLAVIASKGPFDRPAPTPAEPETPLRLF
jgi:ribonuclease HI